MDLTYYENLSVNELEKELRKADKAYREGNAYLSDEIYDYLFDLLREKDPTNPFISEVGAPSIEEKMKAKLPYPMFSLDKIKNEENPLRIWKTKFPGDVLLSEKLDGNSGLFYIKNKEIKLYTRGDGIVGQDISHLVPYIQFFRSTFSKKFLLDNYQELAVRGELIISKPDWEILHKKFPELSNARNVVAGTLNAKTPNPEILATIQFVAYEWIAPGQFEPFQAMDFLGQLGFFVAHHIVLLSSQVTLANLSTYLLERREKSQYEIDGIVVTENKVHIREAEGNPKYSFAFKSLATQETVEVVVTKVEWNISKDGVLKPIVYFPKVNLEGVIIQKATGKNASFIEENRIGPGAKIIITRAGGVIPDILEITKPADSGEGSFPDVEFEWNESHVEILAKNLGEDLKEELEIKRLTHFFVSLETEGVATGVIRKLYEAGYMTVSSILSMKASELAKIEGFKKVSAEKTVKSIAETMKKATPLQVMVASNTFESGFGERKLKSIVEAIPNILDNKIRYVPTKRELLNIEGIAEITADGFLRNLPKFWEFIENNHLEFVFEKKEYTTEISKDVSVKPLSTEAKQFLAKKFVFSGFRDKALQELIEANQGKVMSSISKSTDYLILKNIEEGKGKAEKAIELGVPILSLEQFQARLI